MSGANHGDSSAKGGNAGGLGQVLAVVIMLCVLVVALVVGPQGTGQMAEQTGDKLISLATGENTRVSSGPCPREEIVVVLMPHVPHVQVRDEACSTSKRMLWESTEGSPTIKTRISGTSGDMVYDWTPGVTPNVSYPGATSQVQMTNTGERPATVWFVYK